MFSAASQNPALRDLGKCLLLIIHNIRKTAESFSSYVLLILALHVEVSPSPVAHCMRGMHITEVCSHLVEVSGTGYDPL